jgi:hypothetical protein
MKPIVFEKCSAVVKPFRTKKKTIEAHGDADPVSVVQIEGNFRYRIRNEDASAWKIVDEIFHAARQSAQIAAGDEDRLGEDRVCRDSLPDCTLKVFIGDKDEAPVVSAFGCVQKGKIKMTIDKDGDVFLTRSFMMSITAAEIVVLTELVDGAVFISEAPTSPPLPLEEKTIIRKPRQQEIN